MSEREMNVFSEVFFPWANEQYAKGCIGLGWALYYTHAGRAFEIELHSNTGRKYTDEVIIDEVLRVADYRWQRIREWFPDYLNGVLRRALREWDGKLI